jgi:hypothetical protein
VVRKRLVDLAATISFERNESSVKRLLYANKLRDFFSEDVVLQFEFEKKGPQSIHGRAEVIAFAAFARKELRQALFRLFDISVKLGQDHESAEAEMTLLADIDGEKTAISQELKMRLKKTNGAWLITQIETVRTLQ